MDIHRIHHEIPHQKLLELRPPLRKNRFYLLQISVPQETLKSDSSPRSFNDMQWQLAAN